MTSFFFFFCRAMLSFFYYRSPSDHQTLLQAPPLNMFHGNGSQGSVKTLLDTLKQLERRHADLNSSERR